MSVLYDKILGALREDTSTIPSGGIEFRGTFDISSPLTAEYPKAVDGTAVNAVQTGNGSGVGPTIQAGDFWIVINGGGNIGPSPIAVSDGNWLVAQVDNAANVDADRSIIPTSPLNFGYMNLDQTLTVDPNLNTVVGERYQTIAAALAYAVSQTPSAISRWTVLFSGTNSESFTVPSWVTVRGLGRGSILTGAVSGAPLTGVDPSEYTIENCTLDNFTSAGLDYTVLNNCRVNGTTITGGDNIVLLGGQVFGGDFTLGSSVNPIGTAILNGIFGSTSILFNSFVSGNTTLDSCVAFRTTIFTSNIIGTGGFMHGCTVTGSSTVTGDRVFDECSMLSLNQVNVGQTLFLVNCTTQSIINIDGVLQSTGCCGAIPTIGLGTRLNTGDRYNNTVSGLISTDVQGAIDELATSVGVINITQAALAALVTGNTVQPGATYRVTDRYNLILRGVTTNSVTASGWMTIPAGTFLNANDEPMYTAYDVVNDTFGNGFDRSGNQTVFTTTLFSGMSFVAFNAYLTAIRFGDTAVYNNEINGNLSSFTGAGGIFNNIFEGTGAKVISSPAGVTIGNYAFGSITQTNGAVNNNFVDCSSGLVALGTGAGDTSANTIMGLASINNVNGSVFGNLVSTGGSIANSSTGTVQQVKVLGGIITNSSTGQILSCTNKGNMDNQSSGAIQIGELGDGCNLTSSNTGIVEYFDISVNSSLNANTTQGVSGIILEKSNIGMSDNSAVFGGRFLNCSVILANDGGISSRAEIKGCSSLSIQDTAQIVGGKIEYDALGVVLSGTTNLTNCEIVNPNLGALPIAISNEAHTYKRCVQGFSNFETTIDITGLTTLNLTGYELYGIVYLTSANATETIDTISNMQANHTVEFRPAAGLAITWDNTPVAGAGVGDIVTAGTDPISDGTNGDWLSFRLNVVGYVESVNGQNYV